MQKKHVARAEKLIHTEFREYRVFEPLCHGCGGRHIEWFEDWIWV
jgi:T5orf172 domain